MSGLDAAFRDALVLGLENDAQAENVLNIARPFIERHEQAQAKRIAELEAALAAAARAANHVIGEQRQRIAELEAALHDAAELAFERRDEAAKAAKRIAELEAALGLALSRLIQTEPGDSRAVSDEFVAMAAVHAGDMRPEVTSIIHNACKAIR